jgi:hypothetical protein
MICNCKIVSAASIHCYRILRLICKIHTLPLTVAQFCHIPSVRKIGIILLSILLLVTGGYLFIRYGLLRSEDFKPDLSKSRSVLDLRPALIAKLQQMMKDGTRGLYRLSIEAIDLTPSTSNTTVTLVGVKITVDSTVLLNRDRLAQAPNDVYAISFRELQLSGLGIADLVNQRHIDLENIILHYPEMTIARTERAYNKPQEESTDTASLYDRLTKHVSHLGVRNILIDHGLFISNNLTHRSRNTRFDNLSIDMQDILLDSSTRRDRSRFFFSSNTFISCGRMQRATSDSLYFFRVDSLFLNARAHELTAWNVSLRPRYSKAAFEQKLRYRTDRFDIYTPKLVFRKMHWWRLFNYGSIDCEELDILGGHFYDYVSDLRPPKPVINTRNFPYQVLRKLTLPLNIQQANFHHFNLAYTEYYSPSGKTGTIYFDNINARVTNIINKPAYIHPGMWCKVQATALLMHKTPVQVKFAFDMHHYQNGNFQAAIRVGKTDAGLFNAVTGPLGFFLIKRGEIDSFSVQLQGNNAKTIATTRFFYRDLHISLLEKQKQEAGKPEKKHFLGLLANVFVIKNDNKPDDPRLPLVSVDRGKSNSFFNFNWRAIRLGAMKSIGVPEKYIPK